jgi:glycosyltransferase involved in cell wall biosynthesis
MVSVLIPTLNEEDGISKVLPSIPRELIDEVLVVDSSSDRTAQIAEQLGAKVIRERRTGYGRAIHTAIENASGEILVYIDGDFTYDPTEIPRLLEPVRQGRYDLAIGNRLKEHSNHASMPLLNRIGNRILSEIFAAIYRVSVSDTQCGLRVLRRSPLLEHPYHNYGMAYVTEQLIRQVRAGYRIAEIPVSYRPRLGKSKLRPFLDGVRILWTMLTMWPQH